MLPQIFGFTVLTMMTEVHFHYSLVYQTNCFFDGSKSLRRPCSNRMAFVHDQPYSRFRSHSQVMHHVESFELWTPTDWSCRLHRLGRGHATATGRPHVGGMCRALSARPIVMSVAHKLRGSSGEYIPASFTHSSRRHPVTLYDVKGTSHDSLMTLWERRQCTEARG